MGLVQQAGITVSDVRQGSHAGPPNTNDFTGSILTDQYFFGFGRGHIANFVAQGFQKKTDEEVKRQNIELSKLSSAIDTNGAYRLATNWLSNSGVDIAVTESKYRLAINQWRFYPKYQPTGSQMDTNDVVLLPIYEVSWRGVMLTKSGRKLPEGPVIKLIISGVTKELLQYHVYDDSLFTTSAIKIDAADSLLNISDEEFQSYSELQRSNLVARCANDRSNLIRNSSSPN